MVFKIRVSKLAEIEINEAVAFYESRRKGLGKRFLIYIKGCFEIVKVDPELFAIKKQPCFRELTLKKFPFVIIYEVFNDEIIIYSVFHTFRNPSEKP
jgi:hypothetical protein